MSLLIRETFVNVDRSAQFGQSDPYEAGSDSIGGLFKWLQREYGRCVSRMYVDKRDGSTQAIGWVFRKRMRYDDARGNRPDDWYTREVWVEVMTEYAPQPPEIQYAQLGGV